MTTIATEISRIQSAKAWIKASIEWKWVNVPSDAKIDTYPSYIDQIVQWWWALESVIQYIRDNWYISLNLWRETWDAYGTYDWTITTNTNKVYNWWTILAYNTSFIRSSSHGMRSIATAYWYKNWMFRKIHLELWQSQNTNQWYWGETNDWYLWYRWNWQDWWRNEYYRCIFSESSNPNDSYFELMAYYEDPTPEWYVDKSSWAWTYTVQIPVWSLTANWSMNAQWTWWADVLWYIQ